MMVTAVTRTGSPQDRAAARPRSAQTTSTCTSSVTTSESAAAATPASTSPSLVRAEPAGAGSLLTTSSTIATLVCITAALPKPVMPTSEIWDTTAAAARSQESSQTTSGSDRWVVVAETQPSLDL